MPANLYRIQHYLILIVLLGLTACAHKPKLPPIERPAPPITQKEGDTPSPPIHLPDTTKVSPPTIPQTETKLDLSLLRASQWESIEGFTQDDLTKAWPAWLQSCSALKFRPGWQPACEAAEEMQKPTTWAIRQYLKQYFNVYQTTNSDGTETGLITGYYQPLLKGSRVKSSTYRYPLYAKPDDLLTVELGSVYPELASKRVRGRVVSNKVVPYYSRAEIESDPSPLQGKEFLWIDDIIDVFFLQVQGSGIVQLDNGDRVHVGYADQNGMNYQSIGRVLIDKGELAPNKASMQDIKAWARSHLDKLRDLLNSNPSYVFFRELPMGLPGPLGALGVPLTAERSVAIDQRYVPLGAPVFLSSTYPNTNKPLQRLMVAQDTGGAIKGGVRADFYWGAGNEAGKQAGSMKQSGKIWVLLPKSISTNSTNTPQNIQP